MSTLSEFPAPNTAPRIRPRHVWQWAKAGRSVPALATFVGLLILPVLAFVSAYPLFSGVADTLFDTSADDLTAGRGFGGAVVEPVTGAALAVTAALIVLYSAARVLRRRGR
ncbi:hypothetical protein ACIBSV_24535 [Embleya sp. NPDC050154]|uniref:hypothetical protein n=1 Tax=unclassified Embleya TaxID=2699296 RepID=UPI003792EA71